MIEFYWPGSTGEWLAFAVAVVTVGFGLLLFLMPRLSFGILRLQPVEGRADAIAEGRATMAGFYLGCGLGCLLLLGRLVSIVFDRAGTRFNWLSLLVEVLLAALPLGFAFGMI